MFLKKLLKLLVKKGKFTIAIRNLTKTLRVMRGAGRTSPKNLNFIMFRKLAPLVKIYKKKVAGKVYQLPWKTTKSRAAFQAAKWFVLAVQAEKRGKNFSVKMGKQFVKTLRNKGFALKLRSQFVDLIKENRSYMRFIRKKRFKRRKKFKGRFKSKFTKKTLNSYIFFKFKNKKNAMRPVRTVKAIGDNFKNKKKNSNINISSHDKKYSKKFITKDKKQRR